LDLPGLRFSATHFKPSKDRYKGETCSGVKVEVTDEKAARPVDAFVRAAWILRELNPKEFQLRWAEMPYVTGSPAFQTFYQSGAPAEEYLDKIHGDAENFRRDRASVLLYE
jgi:uncharacterized protein YbbC (DUF1343 family)